MVPNRHGACAGLSAITSKAISIAARRAMADPSRRRTWLGVRWHLGNLEQNPQLPVGTQRIEGLARVRLGLRGHTQKSEVAGFCESSMWIALARAAVISTNISSSVEGQPPSLPVVVDIPSKYFWALRA